MLKNIELKFGRADGSHPETIEVRPVTVFVGPNSSGKSLILKEIKDFFDLDAHEKELKIIKDINFQGDDILKSANDKISKIMELESEKSENVHVKISILRANDRQPKKIILESCEKHNEKSLKHDFYQYTLSNNHIFRYFFIHFFILILNGGTRIKLIDKQNIASWKSISRQSFQTFFQDSDKRQKIQGIVLDAFKKYLVADPTTEPGHLCLRFSKEEPDPSIEESLAEEARNFHDKAQPIEEASDGVKAFIGMIMEIVAGDPLVLLIDEPEAFLHPPMAHRLGKEIANTTTGTDKRIFAATHSADFLMGCVQSGKPVSIVRLTYDDKDDKPVATARTLKNEDLRPLMQDPLLRSTGVLNALFYEAVIVTEGDSDRAFYQEINERLLSAGDERGLANCLFLNAQNKQTIGRIVEPLRKMGIPAAGIVDIDVIKDGERVWKKFTESFGFPDEQHNSLATLRASVYRTFEKDKKGGIESLEGDNKENAEKLIGELKGVWEKLKDACSLSEVRRSSLDSKYSHVEKLFKKSRPDKDMKRDGGIDLLEREDKETAENFMNQLNEYGLFVVRKGELESWLPHLEAPRDKKKWLPGIFEKMGANPDDEDYVKPAEGDVWDFIGQIQSWCASPKRRGLPD